jgi:phospholipid-transporting ATPase
MELMDKSSFLLIMLLYDRAIYMVMRDALFWALLLAVTVVGMIPHFAAKALREYFTPSDIQIAREMEKPQDFQDATHPEVQMSTISRV